MKLRTTALIVTLGLLAAPLACVEPARREAAAGERGAE